MHEPQLIAGAITFALVLAGWLGWDWHKKHPAAERGDLFAEYDRRQQPVREIPREPAVAHTPQFTDRDGRPRLPTSAEITSELQAIGRDAGPAYTLREPARVVPATAPVPQEILEPTAVYAPPVMKAGPEPHEWTWWAGRWWPPASLESALPASDWLRELLETV